MEDTPERSAAAAVIALHPPTPKPTVPLVAFQRGELGVILRVYGQRVAEGEWRDYALDHDREQATFSIFRRSSEVPIYRITKTPKLARRQGAYAVISAGGVVLKRGHDLATVLRVFEKKRHLSVVA